LDDLFAEEPVAEAPKAAPAKKVSNAAKEESDDPFGAETSIGSAEKTKPATKPAVTAAAAAPSEEDDPFAEPAVGNQPMATALRKAALLNQVKKDVAKKAAPAPAPAAEDDPFGDIPLENSASAPAASKPAASSSVPAASSAASFDPFADL